jgi:hypothetical protein
MIRASVDHVQEKLTDSRFGAQASRVGDGIDVPWRAGAGVQRSWCGDDLKAHRETIPRRFRPQMCPTTAIGDIGCPVATDDCGSRSDCFAAHESSHHVRWHVRSRGWHKCIVKPHTRGKTAARALVGDDSRKCRKRGYIAKNREFGAWASRVGAGIVVPWRAGAGVQRSWCGDDPTAHRGAQTDDTRKQKQSCRKGPFVFEVTRESLHTQKFDVYCLILHRHDRTLQ